MRQNILLLALSALATSTSTSQSCLENEASKLLLSISCDQPSLVTKQCYQSTSDLALVHCLIISGCHSGNDNKPQDVFATCDKREHALRRNGVTKNNIDEKSRRKRFGKRIMARQDSQDQPTASQPTATTITITPGVTSSSPTATTIIITPGVTSSSPTATTITITPTPASSSSASSSSSSTKTSSAASATSTSDSSGNHVSTAGIVVGVVLVLFVLLAIGFVIFLNVRRLRQHRQEQKRESVAYHSLLVPPTESKPGQSMYSQTTLATSFLGQGQDPESGAHRYSNSRDGLSDIPLEAVRSSSSPSAARGHRSHPSTSRSISGGTVPMDTAYGPYDGASDRRHRQSTSSSHYSTRSHRSPSDAPPPMPSAINFSTSNHPRHTHSQRSISVSSQEGLHRQFSFDATNATFDHDPVSRETSRASHASALASHPTTPSPPVPVPKLHVRTSSSEVHMVPSILTPGSPPDYQRGGWN